MFMFNIPSLSFSSKTSKPAYRISLSFNHLLFVFQSLMSSNNSGVDGEMEVMGNIAELLRRSILYIEPVDPVYWCGALRKCEGRILPCLRVRWQKTKIVNEKNKN